jgi:repressor LexA
MRRKQIKPEARLAFGLTAKERDLVVERAFLDPEIEKRLRTAEPSGSKLTVGLTLDDLDDLAGCVAAEANHCADKRVRRVLDAVFDRLTKLEGQYNDEEPALPQIDTAARRLPMPARFTAKQGQYLAFIYYYSKLHRRPPAEADLREYFRVSPPVVHQMILALESRGFIERTPGTSRSIQLRIAPAELPELE